MNIVIAKVRLPVCVKLSQSSKKTHLNEIRLGHVENLGSSLLLPTTISY